MSEATLSSSSSLLRVNMASWRIICGWLGGEEGNAGVPGSPSVNMADWRISGGRLAGDGGTRGVGGGRVNITALGVLGAASMSVNMLVRVGEYGSMLGAGCCW